MAETDFTSDVTAENGNNLEEEETQEEPNPEPKDDRKLFVGGLSWETGEAQLKEYFGKFGEVEAVSLKLNAETGKSRCFAFIIYKESASIAKVFEQTEHAINSKKGRCQKSQSQARKNIHWWPKSRYDRRNDPISF